jgi:hypothetical protein
MKICITIFEKKNYTHPPPLRLLPIYEETLIRQYSKKKTIYLKFNLKQYNGEKQKRAFFASYFFPFYL